VEVLTELQKSPAIIYIC